MKKKISEPRLSSEPHASGASVNINYTGYNTHQAVIAQRQINQVKGKNIIKGIIINNFPF